MLQKDMEQLIFQDILVYHTILMYKKYNNNLVIKQEREEYDQELKRYQQSLYNLADRYFITNIQNEVLLKNTEVLRKLNLSLLIFQKQLNEVNTYRLNNLRMKQLVLTDNVSKTIDSIDHFYIPIPFNGTV